MHVVQDEHEVAAQLRLERLANKRDEPACAGGVVLLGSRPGGGGDGTCNVDGERGDAQSERVGHTACEGGERRVVG